jgi:YesN/AraC family two-component response regulator
LIQCTLSGEGMLEYNDCKYHLSPGHFFWIDCQHPQYYYTNPEVGTWNTIWVHFYGANSDDYYEQFLSLNNRSCVALQPSDNSIVNYMEKLISICTSHKDHIIDDIYASGLLTLIMAECINALLNHDNINAEIPDFIKDAQDYITKNYMQKISLDDLSYKYNINKYYFQKLFKRYTRYTPNQFLNYIRLNHAKDLLRTTPRSISEISYDVGINSVNHFINLFKKQEGITPSTFRKMWHNNQLA